MNIKVLLPILIEGFAIYLLYCGYSQQCCWRVAVYSIYCFYQACQVFFLALFNENNIKNNYIIFIILIFFVGFYISASIISFYAYRVFKDKKYGSSVLLSNDLNKYIGNILLKIIINLL